MIWNKNHYVLMTQLKYIASRKKTTENFSGNIVPIIMYPGDKTVCYSSDEPFSH